MTVRWGIAGTGGIASSFVEALASVPDAEVVAVASRTQATADAFAGAKGIGRAHGSYEAMAGNGDVDIVYVATPHHRHHSDTLLYLASGKHVLCEKPMALNAEQVAEMADAARAADRFLMEAIWSRFLPSYRILRSVLDEGRIGEVLHVEASFGFRMAVDPAHRLFDLNIGGGALLDLGIYPVHLAHFVLGVPTAVSASSRIGETGIDEDTVVTMQFDGGALAVARCAVRTNLPSTATVIGTDGTIELPMYMHAPSWVDIVTASGTDRIDAPFAPAGLSHEAVEVHGCLADGRRESLVLPLEESLAIATTLDRARACVALRYPDELQAERK